MKITAKKFSPEPAPVLISLEMPYAAAQALAAVIHHVGGDIHRSPRAHTDAIGAALYAAGVRTDPNSVVEDRSIYFKTQPGFKLDAA